MDQYLPSLLSSGLHNFFECLSSLEPLARRTLIVNSEDWYEKYGYGTSYIFLGAMVACYPVGAIMNFLPYGDIRHWVSFLSGLVLLQTCWGVHWIHTPITSLIAFAMFRLCPRDKIQRIVPTFVMVYLAMAHFQHQYTVSNYLGMDVYFTCSQMILTQKLYMLAYNLHDGYIIAKKAQGKDDKKGEDEAYKAARRCSEFALTDCPTLIQYLGYVFCWSTVLVGPAFEFSQYLAACDGSLHYKVGQDGKRELKGKKIPNCIIPAIIPLLQGFPLITFASIFDRVCNYRRLVTPWYFNLPFGRRLFFNWMTNFIQRQKVYFTWLLAEGSNNIWYAGFEGYDKETGEGKGWSISRGADIWQLETCESVAVGTKAWNKKTSQWLLKYVYIRNKSRLGIVYTVSAIWHGFYPGYYMLASIIWFMSKCERLGRKKISPYLSEKKWSLYGVTCIITIHALGSYATTAFFLRSKDNVMENWRSHYYWGHIACAIYYVLVSQLPTPPKKVSPTKVNGTIPGLKKDLVDKKQQNDQQAHNPEKEDAIHNQNKLETKNS